MTFPSQDKHQRFTARTSAFHGVWVIGKEARLWDVCLCGGIVNDVVLERLELQKLLGKL